MFQLPPSYEIEPAESASVKCTVCKEITQQDYIKIGLAWIDDPNEPDKPKPDPLTLLKLFKRLSVCTVCGTMRLTN